MAWQSDRSGQRDNRPGGNWNDGIKLVKRHSAFLREVSVQLLGRTRAGAEPSDDTAQRRLAPAARSLASVFVNYEAQG